MYTCTWNSFDWSITDDIHVPSSKVDGIKRSIKKCLTKYTSTLYYINICFSICFYLVHNDVSCHATLSLRLFSVVVLSLFVRVMKYSSRFFFKTFFSASIQKSKFLAVIFTLLTIWEKLFVT